MRIISGNVKGRVFDSPAGHKTHPMSEKMRGAIFNLLGDIAVEAIARVHKERLDCPAAAIVEPDGNGRISIPKP